MSNTIPWISRPSQSDLETVYVYIFQINIVAGGEDEEYNNLDSVELNVAGENGWTFGSPLPKALAGLRGVTVMSQFYVTGE